MAITTDATRLPAITFFREGVGQQKFGQRYFTRGTVLRGRASGTFEDQRHLVSEAAARDGRVGLRLEVTTESEDTAWRLEITPEKKESYYPRQAWPYFDAYAYRARGAIEFDLRGAARGKGLGVALRAFEWDDDGATPRSTALDPYLKDTDSWQHVVVPVKN
jgi:hypothetical protein